MFRKASFWVAVGGVSILSQFAIELAARKVPIPGLRQFVGFIHCGPGKAA
ncbi:MAG TPA: hypothetical protein VHA75_01050 [Rugosimonospora sp.]|nr:hypothetical protein [Rugosimonospora sp.]